MARNTYIILALMLIGLNACTNEKATEKALLDEVIKIHDEVMGKEDHLMRNKMKMDTLLNAGSSNAKSGAENEITLLSLRSGLIKADSAMSAWMEHFEPEQQGKSHEEKVKYYDAQKKMVLQIDSQMTAAIETSDNFLKEIQK